LNEGQSHNQDNQRSSNYLSQRKKQILLLSKICFLRKAISRRGGRLAAHRRLKMVAKMLWNERLSVGKDAVLPPEGPFPRRTDAGGHSP
jgi:hypothetical protein